LSSPILAILGYKSLYTPLGTPLDVQPCHSLILLKTRRTNSQAHHKSQSLNIYERRTDYKTENTVGSTISSSGWSSRKAGQCRNWTSQNVCECSVAA